eukprot:798143-Pelagomonas_calceolata.AAC.3
MHAQDEHMTLFHHTLCINKALLAERRDKAFGTFKLRYLPLATASGSMAVLDLLSCIDLGPENVQPKQEVLKCSNIKALCLLDCPSLLPMTLHPSTVQEAKLKLVAQKKLEREAEMQAYAAEKVSRCCKWQGALHLTLPERSKGRKPGKEGESKGADDIEARRAALRDRLASKFKQDLINE